MPDDREPDETPAVEPFVPWRRGGTAERRRGYRRLAVVYLWSAVLFGAVGVAFLDGITRAALVALALLEIVAFSIPVFVANRERDGDR
ncbi:hypothetical protein [Cellulomonas composti]|uniref:Uncharacterized protein n=1 Tax=Cellulomonas composti TaxID=266130 RepID=A0A511JDD8_9CELL|nr:hypothetical protein [Cellulomonas composti]GEL95956.1 hypothetical protein CCO02nite_26140 [Cellulomonas composti]